MAKFLQNFCSQCQLTEKAGTQINNPNVFLKYKNIKMLKIFVPELYMIIFFSLLKYVTFEIRNVIKILLF